MGRVAVTPLLWIGVDLDVPYRLASTPADAVQAVNDGVPAVLGTNGWDTAQEALVLLGLDPETAADRVHHARTGTCMFT
jgi:hypothetical protein